MTEAASASAEQWDRLMAAAQAGDAAAYRTLLTLCLPYVRAIVRRHHAAPDRVEDVVQDVLLTVHRVRHTYDPARPFARWIAAIAHRRSIDALRRRVRIDASETFAPAAYETYADPRANKDMTAPEDSAALGAAIAALPAGQRQAVELLRLKDMTLAEASQASGQSVGALKVSLHRAIRSLQKLMGGQAHGGD